MRLHNKRFKGLRVQELKGQETLFVIVKKIVALPLPSYGSVSRMAMCVVLILGMDP